MTLDLPAAPSAGYRRQVSSPKAPPISLCPTTDGEYETWYERTVTWFGTSTAPASNRPELNVFGDNAPAIAGYESLGYDVIAQQIRKEL